MTESVILHPEKGLNPRVTVCMRCGKDVGLVLLGKNEKIYRCNKCHIVHIGKPNNSTHFKGGYDCVRDGCTGTLIYERDCADHEKIACEICNDCAKEQEEHAEVVKNGGIYFKCKCGATGVIKPSCELASLVREKTGIAAPDPVGIELEQCPGCQTNETDSRD